MKLSKLTSELSHKGERPAGVSEREITSIHYRSQEVNEGGMFVAIPGFTVDGHDFIDDALERGAAAIITQKAVDRDSAVFLVPDARSALASVSGAFYQHPSRHLFIIGITGTNGKTTTSYIVENILICAGFSVGVIGTINYRYLGKTFHNAVTTPESLDLQRILNDMLAAGVTHVVMEVSSHAIDLRRVENCWMDMGIFTNLSHDHLDYHQTIEAYWECKKRLFTAYLSKGPKKEKALAVINHHDKRGPNLSAQLSIDSLSVGLSPKNAVYPQKTIYGPTGISGTISTPKGKMKFVSPLVGSHNLENLLCAVGAGVAMGISLDHIRRGIQGAGPVPGRLEPVVDLTGRSIYIDYAHTPDALENVLCALGKLTTGRIICVFGCGGNRDVEKRPRMGAIAARLSHLAIITSDNPRKESPTGIIEHILKGISGMGLRQYRPGELPSGFSRNGYVIEPDRRRAIRLGIETAGPGDVVLIAGKGHEDYQILGQKTIPFNDKKEALAALETLAQGEGPTACGAVC